MSQQDDSVHQTQLQSAENQTKEKTPNITSTSQEIVVPETDFIENTSHSKQLVCRIMLLFDPTKNMEWSLINERGLSYLANISRNEKAVCNYLIGNLNFESVGIKILSRRENDARIIEIVFCIFISFIIHKCLTPEGVLSKLVSHILYFMDHRPDTGHDLYVLIQIVYLLGESVRQMSPCLKVDNRVLDRLTSILSNSKNFELLAQTMRTMKYLTYFGKLKLNIDIASNDTVVLESVVTAFRTLRENGDFLPYFLDVVYNLTASIYNDESSNRSKHPLQLTAIVIVMPEVLSMQYTSMELLAPADLSSFVRIAQKLPINPIDEADSLCVSRAICYLLDQVARTDHPDLLYLTETLAEMFCWIMLSSARSGNGNVVPQIFSNMSANDRKELIQIVCNFQESFTKIDLKYDEFEECLSYYLHCVTHYDKLP